MKPLPKIIKVLLGILAGFGIGAAMSVVLNTISLFPSLPYNIAGSSTPFYLFLISIPIAIVVAIIPWVIGNGLLIAFLPEIGLTSGIVSTLMGLYALAFVFAQAVSSLHPALPKPFWM